MSKVKTQISLPIILTGLFATAVFLSVSFEKAEPYMYIIVLFLLIYVFSFGISVGQKFSSPIKKILDGANDLSKGNLSSRVYLEAKGELAELAETFNKIAEELEVSRKERDSVEKSVNIKVRARTQEMEETINALEQKIRNRTTELQTMIKNLEKLQEQSMIKEKEIAGLKEQVKLVEESINKKPRKKQKETEETEVI